MEFTEVTDRFLDLEAELGLLDLEVDGVPFWERIRDDVLRNLLQELGVVGQAHTHAHPSPGEALYKLLRNLFVANPLRAPEADLLVWGHERRKRLEDGRWWDVYCDPVLERIEDDWVYLEREHEGGHLTPARTEQVYYLDWINYLSRFPAKALPGPITPASVVFSAAERGTVDRVEREVADRFGAAVDVGTLLSKRLLRRRVKLPLYRRLIRRVDPDLAVVVVSYGRETFVEACRAEGVPVAELQHGELSEYHLGYHYPNGSKRDFPDYFLAFGEFWTTAADFPIPEERILPVGYPYLERRAGRFADVTPERQVVFLSQGEPGERLSRVATEFARLDHDWEVVYKLHPGEASRWREAYPWLEDAPLRIVDGSEPPLYELFARSSAQVGAYSTALYEGLYFDLDTYVLDVPGIECVRGLLETDGATLVRSAGELAEHLRASTGGTGVDLDRFFRRGAEENVVSAIEEIVRGAGSERETTGTVALDG
jgi:hypothetical protein